MASRSSAALARAHGVSRGAIRTAVAHLLPGPTAIEEDVPAPEPPVTLDMPGKVAVDAPILIVDESTAALDARAEQEVFDRIRALADAGRTVVLITHRMASVRDADLVHVLHGGRLVESGTPDELLRGGGRYAETYGIQAAQFARSGAA